MPSKAEAALTEAAKNHFGEGYLIEQVKFKDLVDELNYNSHRRWVFDYLIKGTNILIEVQGSGYGHGGSAKSHANDIVKYRSAVTAGYVVLLLNAKETLDRPDLAIEYIEEAVAAHEKN